MLYTQPFLLPQGGNIKAIVSISNESIAEAITTIYGISPTKWKPRSKIEHTEWSKMIDGDNNTCGSIPYKNSLEIDLNKTVTIKGLAYTPQVSKEANNIYKYNLNIKTQDESDWKTIIHNGIFANIKNNPIRQDIIFKTPINARYIQLKPLETTNNHPSYDIAGIEIIVQ